jgi:hypothetical protein
MNLIWLATSIISQKVDGLINVRSLTEFKEEVTIMFKLGIFNTSFSSEMFSDKRILIKTMDELKVYLESSKQYLGEIYKNHCKDPQWRPGENDFNIVLNAMESTFHALAPLLSIAANSLHLKDESKGKFMNQEVDFEFEFNSFLTMFK